MSRPRLVRSTDNRMIAGVAGGLAEYLEVDVSWVRLIWIFVVLLGGAGILAYIIAWIAIPSQTALQGNDVPVNSSAVQTRSRASFVAGVILISLGIFILLARILSVNIYKYLWPALLIGIGIYILFGTARRNPH